MNNSMRNSHAVALAALLSIGTAGAQEAVLPRTTQLQTPQGPVTVRWGQPAQPDLSPFQSKIAGMDKDGDGMLSPLEATTDAALGRQFKLIDQDHDGRISARELANWS